MDTSWKFIYPKSCANIELSFWRDLCEQKKESVQMLLKLTSLVVVECSLDDEAFGVHKQAQRLKQLKLAGHALGALQRASPALGFDFVLTTMLLLIHDFVCHCVSTLLWGWPRCSWALSSMRPSSTTNLHSVPLGCVLFLPCLSASRNEALWHRFKTTTNETSLCFLLTLPWLYLSVWAPRPYLFIYL